MEILDGLGERLELSFLFSKSSAFEFSDGLSLLDFLVSILDSACHGESFGEDSVEHDLVIGSPLSSVLGESSDGFFSVLLEVGLEVS